jgi:Na+-translocating ferredoxin:NAD+ oxidoreductase RnfD subunit
MMAITRDDNFVSRVADEWRNSYYTFSTTMKINLVVAMIFALSFEIIIQRAVGNESCYPMKNTLIITLLSNRLNS